MRLRATLISLRFSTLRHCAGKGARQRRKKQSMADIQGSKWLEQIFKNLLPVYHKKVMYGFDPTVAFACAQVSLRSSADIFVNKLDPVRSG